MLISYGIPTKGTIGELADTYLCCSNPIRSKTQIVREVNECTIWPRLLQCIPKCILNCFVEVNLRLVNYKNAILRSA